MRIRAEFPANPQKVGHDVAYELEPSSGSTAFGVMDGHNHASLTLAPDDRDTAPDPNILLAHVVEGLSVTDDGFDRLAGENARRLPATVTREGRRHGFQNTVVRVQDQYGVGVDDYLLEFYENDDEMESIAELFHTSAIRSVHKYSDDSSYRSIYVDCTRLRRTIDHVGECLSMSLTAYPELEDRRTVGFTTLGDDGIGGVRIKAGDIATFFQPHRTALVTLQLTRQQAARTFLFSDL